MVGSSFASWFLLMGALLLMGVAFWIYLSSTNARLREKVHVHFNQVLPRGTTISGLSPGKKATPWHKLQVRASIYAGFELKAWHCLAIPMLFILFGMVGWLWLKAAGAILLFIGAVLVIGILMPYARWRRRQELLRAQVPVLIDQMLRSLGSGRSIEGAIRLAATEVPDPLRHIIERIVRATDLGADLPETFSEAAQLHGLRELNLIALAIRISNSYGSSPREMLQSVVHMIRQRELAQRELAAMTGETKISAWVLGLLPIALMGYMMAVNPSYFDSMLADPTGQLTLEVAGVLQLLGVFVLWRMIKSV